MDDVKKPGGEEPDLTRCRTRLLAGGFCECTGNRTECKFALPAGPARSLCMHKDNYNFRVQYLNDDEQE